MSIQSNANHRKAVGEMLVWLRKSNGPGFTMVEVNEVAVGVLISEDMKLILYGVPYKNGYLFS